MAMVVKYRIHEVAKDFNVASKEISQILTDYVAPPKNHMQVLENPELDIIFEYMTQHNEAASLEDIFKTTPAPVPAKAEKAAPAPAKKGDAPKAAAKPAQNMQNAKPAPAQPQQQTAAADRQNKPHVPRKVAEKRVVDTRGGAAVNIEKYNEKFEDMAGMKGNDSMRRANKEKINSKSKQRPNQQAASAKRRQEERDKMNRLQLEIAKKQQLKVQIPDEISVGDLASRMKKTAAEVIKQLFKMGVFASVSEIIDYDTAALVAMELGCKVEKEVIVTVEEKLIDDHEDKAEDLVDRAPVVVAINKMDTVGANPERIKQQLTEYDLISEEWGGDTIICPISAKTGMGIDNLLENLVVLAEVQELKANPNRAAKGTVIEARLDKGRGPIMTVLVQNGTLRLGDIIIAGTSVGRVRTMLNDKGQRVSEAGPSMPVEISGLSEVPTAGDVFNAVADERMARELAEERRIQQNNAANGGAKKVSLEDLFSQIQAGEMKTLNIIVKADVQGSAEAVKSSLEKISNEEVRVKVIHSGVGAINESDVMLAATSGAIIVGFNVRPDNAARDSAARSNVDMRMYRVIYDCINEIEAAMKGMLAPKFKEVIIGHAEVRETYKVSKVGTVCGCYCTDGKIQRGCEVRVLRDNIVIHEGNLASLRRFKDDVKEVASGYECGMQVEKFNDIKVGDTIECFVMEQINP